MSEPLPSISARDSFGAVFAGFLGWTLDAFDFFLVVMCLTAIAKDFHKTVGEIALSLTVTLAFRPVGAFLFGLMADACEIAKRAAISNSVAAKCEAVHADAGARVCGLKSRGIDTQGKKRWSGRRESNPRMQLGKLPFCH